MKGWLEQLWDEITGRYRPATWSRRWFSRPARRSSRGFSYFGILSAAYPGEVFLWPIITAYAVGVAANGFLPANLGTFMTLIMFVTIIPSCTLGGSVAAYLVQKIFFTIAGTFVYLYMFLSVPGAFDISFGKRPRTRGRRYRRHRNRHRHRSSWRAIFWRQVKKLWAQAKQGGVILTTRRGTSRVPSCPSSSPGAAS